MNVPDITVETLQSWFDSGRDIVFLDVREPHELTVCKFDEMTHNITMGNLPKDFSSLPEGKPVVVCCRSGVRSIYATRFLIEEGYDQAVNLKGGILEYIRYFGKDWTTY